MAIFKTISQFVIFPFIITLSATKSKSSKIYTATNAYEITHYIQKPLIKRHSLKSKMVWSERSGGSDNSFEMVGRNITISSFDVYFARSERVLK